MPRARLRQRAAMHHPSMRRVHSRSNAPLKNPTHQIPHHQPGTLKAALFTFPCPTIAAFTSQIAPKASRNLDDTSPFPPPSHDRSLFILLPASHGQSPTSSCLSLYFFTHVTYQRHPWLSTDLGRKALREAIITVRQKHPFAIDAFVLLPDHFHCILTLPEKDASQGLQASDIEIAYDAG